VNDFSVVDLFGHSQQRLLLDLPLSKSEKIVLISLPELEGYNLYNICKYLKLPDSTVKYCVRKLVSRGILERENGVFLTKFGKELLGLSSNGRIGVSKTSDGRSTRSGPTKKMR
jgi:DNA-binding MarR family transcriptional regulator